MSKILPPQRNPSIKYYTSSTKDLQVEINKLLTKMKAFSSNYRVRWHEKINEVQERGSTELTIYEVINYLETLRDVL